MMKIISGGQTGIDRAALDSAIKLNIPHGGWCPKGRLAEDGIIPEKYVLKETDTRGYSKRTQWNIRDSDGTLILIPDSPDKISGGTALTLQEAKTKNKPYLIISLSITTDIHEILFWLNENRIKILNIAGPRESQSPGIYAAATRLIENLLSQCYFSLQ